MWLNCEVELLEDAIAAGAKDPEIEALWAVDRFAPELPRPYR